MALEIERKWLLKLTPALDHLLASLPSIKLEQYYTLITNNSEIRYRKKADKFFVTEKQGSGLTRIENEREIAEGEFVRYLGEQIGSLIVKIRYKCVIGKFTIELDRYLDPPLENFIICEVEFKSEQEANDFDLRATILGEEDEIVEVTNIRGFDNRELARLGKFPITKSHYFPFSLDDLVNYMVSKGWNFSDFSPHLQRATLGQTEVFIMVPTNLEQDDFISRIKQVLEKLAIVQRIDKNRVIDELLLEKYQRES